VSLDPLGGVSVAIDSVPQGQGHCTATAQIVADIFGLAPEAIRVEAAIDTGKDAWSIAAGNYSSRFAGATAGAVHFVQSDKNMRLREGRISDQLEERSATPLTGFE
jgi:2-furoyl-CoA dehydrogenase large subunit